MHPSKLNTMLKQAIQTVKSCYWVGCENKPIKAHGISKTKLLTKLSVDGNVMYMNLESENGFELINTGQAKATTFPGFCDTHDKIFNLIDTADYDSSPQMDFLFAMRNAAKETLHKLAANLAIERMISESNDPEFIEALEYNLSGARLTAKEYELTRKKFCDLYEKKIFNALNSQTIVIDRELPIVCSASFYLELDHNNKIINNTLDETSRNLAPLFMTLFPQNGKTYCIFSYFKSDKAKYAFLNEIMTFDQNTLEIIVSNILPTYTESFAVSPRYWNRLGFILQQKIIHQFEITLMPGRLRPLVLDPNLNLFDWI